MQTLVQSIRPTIPQVGDLQALNGHILSNDDKYLYLIWRKWDALKPFILFVGLNPSLSDPNENHLIIRRCSYFAKIWGGGGFYMANLFAFRANFPVFLFGPDDPVGTDNIHWIKSAAQLSNRVVFAWGNYKLPTAQDEIVIKMFPEAWCMGYCQNGAPKHPLRLGNNTKLIRFNYHQPTAY